MCGERGQGRVWAAGRRQVSPELVALPCPAGVRGGQASRPPRARGTTNDFWDQNGPICVGGLGLGLRIGAGRPGERQ